VFHRFFYKIAYFYIGVKAFGTARTPAKPPENKAFQRVSAAFFENQKFSTESDSIRPPERV
jgi:hypothetical protein